MEEVWQCHYRLTNSFNCCLSVIQTFAACRETNLQLSVDKQSNATHNSSTSVVIETDEQWPMTDACYQTYTIDWSTWNSCGCSFPFFALSAKAVTSMLMVARPCTHNQAMIHRLHSTQTHTNTCTIVQMKASESCIRVLNVDGVQIISPARFVKGRCFDPRT